MKSFSLLSFLAGLIVALMGVATYSAIDSYRHSIPYTAWEPGLKHDAGFQENTFKKAGAILSSSGSYSSSFTSESDSVEFTGGSPYQIINRENKPSVLIAIDAKKKIVLGEIKFTAETDLRDIDFLAFTPKRIYQYNWVGIRGRYFDRESIKPE